MERKIFQRHGLRMSFFFFLPILIFAEQKNIFFLYTNPETFPWTKNLNEGIEEVFNEKPDWAFFSESLDVPRLRESLNEEDWYDYISKKYHSVEFDAVLAEGGKASRFINTYGQELFGDIPNVLQTYEILDARPHTFYLKNQQDQAVIDTFEMAMRQNPKKRKLVVINNNAGLYLSLRDSLWQLANESHFHIEEITDFSMEELLQTIKNLKGNEIVFYFLVSSDNTGAVFIPRDVIAEIAKISPSPVYTFWSSLKETGIVGGVMVDSKTIALEMFRAVDDYFQTGAFQSGYRTNQAFINWNTIKPFHLKIRDFSDDIIILNRPVPLLKVYFTQIMTIMSFIFASFLALALYSRYRIVKTGNQLKEALKYQSQLLQQQEMLRNDLVEASKLSSLGMMVAGVAHELNTPVGAAMLSGTQLDKELTGLRGKFESGLTRQDFLSYMEKVSKGLELLHKNHEKAASLIVRFKRLAYERSNEKIHTFRLKEAVEDLLETSSPRIRNSSVNLNHNVPDDLTMQTLYNPLSQVLQNLVINAVEHAFPEGGSPGDTISINAYEQEDGMVAIEVRDTGSGIKPEIRENIFDPFATSRRQFGNTGLGLHFVHKWVTTVLKGKLSVDSAPGKGTTFLITIPKVFSKEDQV